MASLLSIGRGALQRSHASRISSMGFPLSSDALQPGPVHFEPLVSRLAVSFIQRVEPRIKIGAMVHMADVRDLMRDDRAAYIDGGHDQSPTKRNSTMAGATTPTAPRIAKRQARDGSICLGAIKGDFLGKYGTRFGFQPAQDACFNRRFRAAKT